MKVFKSILILCSVITFQFLYAESYSTAEPRQPENIQVLLEKNVNEALIEAKGSYIIYNPQDGSKVSSGILGKRFMVRATSSGIKWGEEFPGIHQIYIMPKSKDSSLLVNGIQYEGAVAIFKAGSKINIINDINIESFLKSTLTPQFPYPLENEVMAAVAIAARTTAYSHVNRNKDAFWHISKDEAGYQGAAIIQPDSAICNAVDRTRHLILVHSEEGQNKAFAALWTENSAGQTAPFHKIYRKDWSAPKEGVDAPHAKLNREQSKWSYTVEKQELAKLLNLKTIKELKLYTDEASNKTYAVRISDESENKDLDFIAFQEIVGKDNLLSNDIKISVQQNKVIFTGYGKGLGVGICLNSAASMAQNGDTAVKILSKFYPESFLLNLSAMPKPEKSLR